MGDWRYLAQNLVTGEWLHTDLPLSGVEIEQAVSAPGGINGFIGPETADLLQVGGQPLLREWQAAIYAEEGNVIRGAGILTHATQEDDGQQWNIECPGFGTYPYGMSYTGNWAVWRPDVFDAVREIWRHLQAQPDGNLNMVVDTGLAGIGVGDVKPPPRPTTSAQALTVPTKGPMPVQGATEASVDYLTRVEAWEVAYAAALAVYRAAKAADATAAAALTAAKTEWDTEYKDRVAYRLAWYEEQDCGGEIDRLSEEAAFDWYETHEWVDSTRQEVAHRFHLAHPMRGTRRPDLRFAVGENIVIIPDVLHDGADFANYVTGLGKGDGRKMLRSTVGARDGRLRRAGVAAFKDVGNRARLRALTDAEQRRRRVMTGIDEIVVVDHPNAPLGSWALGDEVVVDTKGHGWMQDQIWVRIVSQTIAPDDADTIRLKVVNSERI